MNVVRFPGNIKPHYPELCDAGGCDHAVSERNPCRCPQCAPDVAEIVTRYRDEQLALVVDSLSEVGARFAERTFAKFDVSPENRNAYDAAQAVMDDPRTRGIGFYGKVGTGKSHLAAAIVNACIGNKTPAAFVNIEILLSRLRSTFDKATKEQTENGIINGYARVAVLALDDLGKESLSDYTVRTLYALINRRYENSLPLIVTSNFSGAALAGRKVAEGAEPSTYAATIDRIREMTGDWVEVLGRSRR